jgi:hypothetical protein
MERNFNWQTVARFYDSDHYRIPSMTGEDTMADLYKIGENLTGEGCVVELGTWLGATLSPVAAAIARNNKNIEIHSYDRFCATDSEVSKLLRFREIPRILPLIQQIKKGQNTLPIVKAHLDPINPNINYYKGKILEAKWKGAPIELYMDDACKTPRLFLHAIKTFSPFWIPNKTIFVLMDFNYWRKTGNLDHKCQLNFVKKHPDSFKKIKEYLPAACAMFLYKEKLELE